MGPGTEIQVTAKLFCLEIGPPEPTCAGRSMLQHAAAQEFFPRDCTCLANSNCGARNRNVVLPHGGAMFDSQAAALPTRGPVHTKHQC